MYTGLDLSPEGPCEQESMARQHASENRPTPLAFYVIARDVSTNQLYHHPSLLSLDSVTHSDMCPTVQKSGNCHSVKELQRKRKNAPAAAANCDSGNTSLLPDVPILPLTLI